MTDAEFRSRLSPTLAGSFLFFGEEDYLRRHALFSLRKALLPTDDPFSHSILHGTDGLDGLADAIAQPPMFSPVHLVELHELNIQTLSSDAQEQLVASAETAAGQGDVCFVLFTDPSEFDPGNLPKRPSALYKKLTGAFTPVEFSRVTGGRLAAWAGRHFAHEQIIAEPAELDMLIARCGTSMSGLAGEIDKLCAYIHARGEDRLTPEYIEAVTCLSVETDAFGLSNAVLKLDAAAAFAALADMRDRRVEPIIALSGITRVCCDLFAVSMLAELGQSQAEIAAGTGLHPYKTGLYLDALKKWGPARVQAAEELCIEADLAVKSSRSGYIAVERLLSRIVAGEAGR